MDIGVLLPTGTTLWGAGEGPRELLALGRRAERSGFSSLFVNDSLTGPRVEALTALAALAPVTDDVTLGTAALLPFLRRPVQAAQSLASVDLLSEGRLVVTVGAGFPGRFGRPLYALSQVPWERRFARLDETVALWRALWDGAPSFHGEFFHADELPPVTRPFRTAHPPVWLGGATPAAVERAGRLYDGWLPYPPDPADYASGLAAVHDAAAGAGRDRGGITPALFVSVRIDDDAVGGRRVLDDFARAAYGLPLTELERIQAVVTGTAAQVLHRLREYAAAGARHLVVRLAAPDLRSQSEQLDRLAALIPAVGAPTATGTAPASGRQ